MGFSKEEREREGYFHLDPNSISEPGTNRLLFFSSKENGGELIDEPAAQVPSFFWVCLFFNVAVQ